MSGKIEKGELEGGATEMREGTVDDFKSLLIIPVMLEQTCVYTRGLQGSEVLCGLRPADP